MKREILVDARDRPPPEPMEQVLAALDRLKPGEYVRFIAPREPLPLYPLLRRMGCTHTAHLQPDGSHEVLIQPPE